MDFSYSRLSTYRRCPRQFNWHYIQQINIEQPYNIETLQGLALHDYAENQELVPDLDYDISIEDFELEYNARLPREIKKAMEIGRDRVRQLFMEYIKKKQDEGYQLQMEQEYIVDFHGHQYTAKIDILLLKRGTAVIIDYKTGQTTNTDYYKEQLALYKMAISKSYTIPEDDIQTKACLLLAPVPNKWLSSFFLNVAITSKEYQDYQKKALETLTEIETTPKDTPCLNKMCKFCQYRKVCEIAIICQIK